MFYDRFVELCKKKNVSANRALIDCKISRTAVAKWKSGSTPNGSNIQKLADYFNVSTDYLLGTETEKAPVSNDKRQISDDDLIFALWGDSENIDKNDLDDVKKYAAFVEERKKKS